MFVWVLLSNSNKNPSFIDVIITGKGLNNFTYIRQPIIMVISEDP